MRPGPGQGEAETNGKDTGGGARLGALASKGQAREASELLLLVEAEAGDTRRERLFGKGVIMTGRVCCKT